MAKPRELLAMEAEGKRREESDSVLLTAKPQKRPAPEEDVARPHKRRALEEAIEAAKPQKLRALVEAIEVAKPQEFRALEEAIEVAKFQKLLASEEAIEVAKPQKRRTLEEEEVAGPDRLSELPDHMLLHVLSFLPTQEAARTSLLSHLFCYL